MAITQEMFRFVSTRRLERAMMSRVASRLVRDTRPPTAGSPLVQLFGPGTFDDKLQRALDFAATEDFLPSNAPVFLVLDPVAAFFRAHLLPQVPLADLAQAFREQFPPLAALLDQTPPAWLVQQTQATTARLWDSLYALTILGCDRFVSTNSVADGLRVFHVLRLLWMSAKLSLAQWPGATFDEYDTLIDLEAAATPMPAPQGSQPPAAQTTAPSSGRTWPDIRAGAGLAATAASFRTPLAVGSLQPPGVGDLLIVEQTLRRYEQGELARIETIMQGERRERTLRSLNRTSQTTSTETTQEQEDSSSLKVSEQFQLSTQAQQAAQQSVSVQAGVNVSGKFGPVQVSASVNASFDTSKSSSESTSQEYAKSVTEEATRRVRSVVKESSSITVVTELQDTAVSGFNNQAGTGHVNGLYRWVDKIYDAQLVNYGRRLMLPLNVPVPAAFYRSLMTQEEAELLGDLAEPVAPARIDTHSLAPLPPGAPGGFLSHKNISEANYAKLAALYDVSVKAPPPQYLTGSKALVYPEAMEARLVENHGFKDELSYVFADNSLTLDPGYRLTHLGVYAPEGTTGLNSYADALKLGEDKPGEKDLLLVTVADMSFYLTAKAKDGGGKEVGGNFNIWQAVPSSVGSFGSLVQPAIPITVTALFEGVFTLSVIYKAARTDEAMDAWQSSTFAAIVKGYNAKKQAYEQALTAAQAQVKAGADAKTFALREDQYRSIELTEIKRGCIELISAGTAAGYTSISFGSDGIPRIVQDPAEGALIDHWRAPLANGSVAAFFETAFDWDNVTYQFHPYYWTEQARWEALAQATGADPVFEQFLRAGSASVVVPVRPGYERPVIFFLKTGLVWGGGYLSLFTNDDMLNAYADVEQGRQFDPPLPVGPAWEVRVPTSMVMLQAGDTLPEFPPDDAPPPTTEPPEPVPDDTVPF